MFCKSNFFYSRSIKSQLGAEATIKSNIFVPKLNLLKGNWGNTFWTIVLPKFEDLFFFFVKFCIFFIIFFWADWLTLMCAFYAAIRTRTRKRNRKWEDIWILIWFVFELGDLKQNLLCLFTFIACVCARDVHKWWNTTFRECIKWWSQSNHSQHFEQWRKQVMISVWISVCTNWSTIQLLETMMNIEPVLIIAETGLR